MAAALVIVCPAWKPGEDGAGNGHLRVELAVVMPAAALRATLAMFDKCDAPDCAAALTVPLRAMTVEVPDAA